MRKLLWPFSWVYGLAVYLRNLAFDKGVLKEVAFDVPLIVIGNLSSGGTGKSPLVQMLAGALSEDYRVAILSRGYGRSTKGFRKVTKGDTARQSGDEPLQYVHALERVTVAVCEDRVEGIRRLLADSFHPEVILLDDAYQHRYVKPGFSVLLTDFSRPYFSDSLLPSGNLREPASAAKRANVIVVTKCPPDCSAEDRNKIKGKLRPSASQQVLFSYIHYRNQLQCTNGKYVGLDQLRQSAVLLVCGIANPQGLIDFVSSKTTVLDQYIFPDHHPYAVGDVLKLKNRFTSFSSQPSIEKYILTTRKDFMRLQHPELQHLLKDVPILILDIEPVFFQDDQPSLMDLIRKFVSDFKKNR